MESPKQDNPPKDLTCQQDQPKPDYYIENGLYVFTEEFHLRRGFCCKSGCRHCPYGFRKKQ